LRRVGIIQGRLSLPVNGHIQEFPDDWQKEFKLLGDCGLNHIEWLITAGSENTNPAFDEQVSLSNFPISSLCADTLVDERIVDKDFLDDNLTPICLSAIRNKINNITIPLLEGSNVEDSKIRGKFKELIVKYADRYPSINFSFECELSIGGLRDILELSDSFYVTYDTGNITSYGVEHEKYIDTFHSRISNVHLKDRTYDARTVPPDTGDTDFTTIFRKLKSVGYDGIYTLQTSRGDDGNEINNILEHKKILKGLYNEK
tara:strand:+ start:1127 stop:1903 length:777 start_codon:yes stop_codon:yes gene_type:complete